MDGHAPGRVGQMVRSIRPTLTTETREGKFPMPRYELEARFQVPKYSPRRRRGPRESTADDVTR
jgi:hypothetical protein